MTADGDLVARLKTLSLAGPAVDLDSVGSSQVDHVPPAVMQLELAEGGFRIERPGRCGPDGPAEEHASPVQGEGLPSRARYQMTKHRVDAAGFMRARSSVRTVEAARSGEPHHHEGTPRLYPSSTGQTTTRPARRDIALESSPGRMIFRSMRRKSARTGRIALGFPWGIRLAS